MAYEQSETQLYEKALREHAIFLGMDPDIDQEFMYIADEALKAPLPENWEQGFSDTGTPYYYNVVTNESIWEHPNDSSFRKKFQELKAKNAKVVKEDVMAFDEFSDDDDIVLPVKKPIKSNASDMKRDNDMDAKKSTGGIGRDWKNWMLDDDDAPMPTTKLEKSDTTLQTAKHDKNSLNKKSSKHDSSKKSLKQSYSNVNLEDEKMEKHGKGQDEKQKELLSTIRQLEKEITALKTERDATLREVKEAKHLKMKNSELEHRIEEMRKKASLEEDAVDLSSTVEEYKLKCSLLEKRCDNLMAAASSDKSTMQKMDQLEQQIEHSNEKCQKLQMQLDTANDEVLHLKNAALKEQTLHSSSKDELATLQASLKQAEMKYKQQMATLEALEVKEKRLTSELHDEQQQYIKFKQQTEEMAQQAKQSHQIENSELLSAKEKVQAICDKYEQVNIPQLKETIQSLSSEILALKKSFTDTECNMARADTARKREQEESRRKQISMDLLEKELQEREERSKQKEDHLTAIRTSLDREIDNLKIENSHLRTELQSTIESSANELRAVEGKKAKIECDLVKITEKCHEAEKWRKQESARVQDKNDELLECQNEMSRIRKRLTSGEADAMVGKLRDENASLSQAAAKSATELEAAIKSHQAEKLNLEVKLTNLQQEISRQIPELALASSRHASKEWKMRYKESIQKLKEEFSDRTQREISKLARRELQCKAIEDESRKAVQDFQIENQALKKELLHQTTSRKGAQDQLHVLQQFISNSKLVDRDPQSNELLEKQILSMRHQCHKMLNDESLSKASTTPDVKPFVMRDVKIPPVPEFLYNNDCDLDPLEDVAIEHESYPTNLDRGKDVVWYKEGYWKEKYLKRLP